MLHLLVDHDLEHVADLLHRARQHRNAALQMLRRLADHDDRHTLDPGRVPPHLEQVRHDLRTAGLLLVDADNALLNALGILPPTGGDRYTQ